MTRKARVFLTSLLVGFLLLYTTGSAWARYVLQQPDVKEQIVRAVYNRMLEYTAYSGEQLEFTLGGFQTISQANFGNYLWQDIVSMPDGYMINMDVDTGRNFQNDPYQRIYTPEWIFESGTWTESGWASEVQNKTVAEVLNLTAADFPIYSQVWSLTTYNVTVSMDVISRTYKAAFLWLPSGGLGFTSLVDPMSGQYNLLAVDHITKSISDIVFETYPAATSPYPIHYYGVYDSQGSLVGEDIGSIKLLDEPTGPHCRADTFSGDAALLSDSHSDQYGNYFSSFKFRFTCRCSSNCTSTCSASITNKTCRAPSTRCYRTSYNGSTAGMAVQNGHQKPAKCGWGAACAVIRCVACNCGGINASLTVRVRWAGPGPAGDLEVTVNWPSGGDSRYQHEFKYEYQCPPCQQIG